MAKTKSEGQEVREAFDGPKVEHDALISHYAARDHEKGERSSDASESADKTNKFLDETGLNSQALRWGGSIVGKLAKKDGQNKAMDIIRSMKCLLPMLENHVAGQGTTEMNLGEAETDPADGDAETSDDQPDVDQIIKDGDPDLADEAAEFDAQASSTVTPINFGGAKA
tara:strand:- start:104 stop:610 length:507 start_codon:yes stop_codon:yes gene_type:complete